MSLEVDALAPYSFALLIIVVTLIVLGLTLSIWICGCSDEEQKIQPKQVFRDVQRQKLVPPETSGISHLTTKTEYTVSAVTMPSNTERASLDQSPEPHSYGLDKSAMLMDTTAVPDFQLQTLRHNEDQSVICGGRNLADPTSKSMKNELPSLRMTSFRSQMMQPYNNNIQHNTNHSSNPKSSSSSTTKNNASTNPPAPAAEKNAKPVQQQTKQPVKHASQDSSIIIGSPERQKQMQSRYA